MVIPSFENATPRCSFLKMYSIGYTLSKHVGRSVPPRDTEKSQKVHSFGQIICYGLEIWFGASLYEVLQICKTAKNWRPYWFFGRFPAKKKQNFQN